MTSSSKIKRALEGVVVSDRMAKTVVVAVTRKKMNKKYQKYFVVTKRYKAHAEKNDYRVGDRVKIEETKPISKEKKWVVAGKITKA